MRINWITIRVKDLEASKRFYEEVLGMRKEREFSPNPAMRIVFYGSETGTEIELIADQNAAPNQVAPSNLSIGVVPADFDAVLHTARTGGFLTCEPVVFGGNMECCFISDPDGVSLQIIRG